MSGLDDFLYLAKNKPEDLYRYAMDSIMQGRQNHVKDWETREPGSLKGILNAYACTLPKIINKQPFTSEDILLIYKACTENTKHINVDLNDLELTGFNKYPATASFSIDSQAEYKKEYRNCSVDGMRELAHYCIEKKDYSMFPEWFVLTIQEKEITSADELGDFLISATGLDGSGVPSLDYKGQQNNEENTRLAELVDQILKDIQDRLETTKQEDKIALIAQGIQQLERIHPFPDCNCRTFCLVLLNAVLMQHGFPPSIIENPNRFDGHSVAELTEMIKRGIEKTNTLSTAKDTDANNNLSGKTVEELTDYAKELRDKICFEYLKKDIVEKISDKINTLDQTDKNVHLSTQLTRLEKEVVLTKNIEEIIEVLKKNENQPTAEKKNSLFNFFKKTSEPNVFNECILYARSLTGYSQNASLQVRI